MKKLGVLGAVALLAVTAGLAIAAELESGLQPGDSVGAFTVEKVAGNPNDNVKVGNNLCYRCMLGSKPVVMVFARKPNKPLATLIKKLDAELPQHADQKLSSFVNIIGSDDAATLKSTAKKFGEEVASENIAIVVPDDSENGPKEFKLSPDAEVTVILYRNGKVEANHAFGPGKLDDKGIASVIADTAKIIN